MKALFVFAHPDDESMATGGTIAKFVQEGVSVKLITETKGEAGLRGNPPLCSSEELGKVREEELRNAGKILGIQEIYFFDYIDATLHKVPLSELTEKILTLLKKERPDVVFTFDEEGGTRHPDHIQIGKAATKAFLEYLKTAEKQVRLYYKVNPRSFLKKLEKEGVLFFTFAKVKGSKDVDISTIIDISSVLDIKIQAVKCHKTQQKDWENFLKWSHHKEYNNEYFRLAFENAVF